MRALLRHIATTALTLTGVSAQAMDACLLGWWEADYAVMAEQFAATMQANSVAVTGGAYMNFAEDARGEYVIAGLTMEPDMPNVPPMTVTIDGGGSFTFEAEDGVFMSTMGEFSYSAKARSAVLGEMDFPINDTNAPFGGGMGGYSCSDTALELAETTDTARPNSFVKRWNRLAGDPR